ncbi:hypothetical protein [Streptomyces sp. NPDC005970]|uniref:hypothetical protein n=1 Tax=Streptomyces sp. NPDC005970 TaxID=3156723 RepID=UPI00340985AF
MPVDHAIEEVAAVGGPLKKYRVVSATGVETVMKLNSADAEARGLTESDMAPGRGDDAVLSLPDDDHTPAAGQDGGEPGPGDGEDQAPEKKARATAANKARTSSANKGRSPRARGGAGGGG